MTFIHVHMLVLHFSNFFLISKNAFENCLCLLKEKNFEKGEKQVFKQVPIKIKK